MSRISIPSVDNSPEASKPLLAAVKQSIGIVPNLMKLVGHSPAALEGYLSLNGALNKGRLSAGLREQIALAVAEYNGCDYCLSAHDYLGRNVAKLSGADIDAARDFHASDARHDAALVFARRVLEQHGRVSDDDLSALREASTVEIVVNVALNILTNYVNNVARTEIDFPKVLSRLSA
jgi:uncharacterized peroxidase-related enzyme